MPAFGVPAWTLASAGAFPPGWWQYKKQPVKPKQKPKEAKKAPAPKTPAAPVPDLNDYTARQLMTMPVGKFKPLLSAFLDKAVSNPTVSNVHDYYVVLDVARRRALAFTNVAAYVWQRYPDLSTARDYPVTAPGRNAMFSEQYSDVQQTILAARDDFALLYFYSPT